MQPYHVYQGGNIDNVNLDNGSLNVRIPLVSYPQRGSQLALDFALVFSGSGNYGQTQCELASLPGSDERVTKCSTSWFNGIGQSLSLLPGVYMGGLALVDSQDLAETQTSLPFINADEVQVPVCTYTICTPAVYAPVEWRPTIWTGSARTAEPWIRI
jgi:hypothetical protein